MGERHRRKKLTLLDWIDSDASYVLCDDGTGAQVNLKDVLTEIAVTSHAHGTTAGGEELPLHTGKLITD